jgi:hypothetical protein
VTPEDLDVANRYLDEIKGRPLISFRMGGGVRLEFGGEPYFAIFIEGRLRMALPGGVERHADPLTADVAAVLLALLNTEVTTATLSPDGALTVVLGEVRLVVEADEMYESWQLSADNGLLLAGLPGGDVAIWSPDKAS